MQKISTGMTLYDVNIELMKNAEPINFYSCIDLVNNYFLKKLNYGVEYFMLLCNEMKDYTVFNWTNFALSVEEATDKFTSGLEECIQCRGQLLSIELTKDNDAFEIWIKHNDDNNPHCYYLFPYDYGVIEA